jgi:DNA-binding transcriptional MerR regulator
MSAKAFYRIGEAASLVGVETHVLRYWEREFRTIRPAKSSSGQRVYSSRDVEKLKRVRELLYTEGFTIAGARKWLRAESSDRAESSTAPQTQFVPSVLEPIAEFQRLQNAATNARILAPPAHAQFRAQAHAAPTTTLAVSPAPAATGNSETRAELLALRSELAAMLAELTD